VKTDTFDEIKAQLKRIEEELIEVKRQLAGPA
jgi:hypothetical protein